MQKNTDWVDTEGTETTTRIIQWCDSLALDQADRCRRAADRVRRYFSLEPSGGYNSGYHQTNTLNQFRSLVSTLTAHIGSVQHPKVQFVTSDADWQVRRRAKKMDQLVEAIMSQPAGPCGSVHELRTLCLRDAAIFDDFGAAQVRVFGGSHGIIIERVLPWEVVVDTLDARYGSPSQWGRVYPVHRATLKAWFPGHGDAIDAAEPHKAWDNEILDLWNDSTITTEEDFVTVREVWRLKQGGVDGRHVLCIQGCSPLLDEVYDSDDTPFAIIRGDYPVVGPRTRSIISGAIPLEDEANALLSRMQESVKRTSMGQTWIQQGSVMKDFLDSVQEDASIYEYAGPQPPVTMSPEPFGAAQFQFLQYLLNQSAEITGVSQMAATGEAKAGLDSGKAIREATIVQSKRFAWLWRQVEQWSVTLARHIVSGLRRAYNEDEDFCFRWPGETFLREIKWSEASLDDDAYLMQVYPTNEIHGTPADRAQSIDDLYARGLVSPGAYTAAQQTPLDVDRLRRNAAKQEELLDKMISTWLDASDEQLESGYVDYNADEPERPLVVAPLKWLDLPTALAQVATSYLDAEIDGVPEQIKALYLQWLELADAELRRQQDRMAQLAATQQQGPIPAQ